MGREHRRRCSTGENPAQAKTPARGQAPREASHRGLAGDTCAALSPVWSDTLPASAVAAGPRIGAASRAERGSEATRPGSGRHRPKRRLHPIAAPAIASEAAGGPAGPDPFARAARPGVASHGRAPGNTAERTIRPCILQSPCTPAHSFCTKRHQPEAGNSNLSPSTQISYNTSQLTGIVLGEMACGSTNHRHVLTFNHGPVAAHSGGPVER